MSDTLEEKLRDILLSRTMGQYMHDDEGNYVPVNWHDSPVIDQYVTEIKQAFQDAGYAPYNSVHQYKRDGMVQLCMTGEEFYNRFKTEIEKQSLFDLTADEFTQSHKEYLQAAKRAAGLTEKEGA